MKLMSGRNTIPAGHVARVAHPMRAAVAWTAVLLASLCPVALAQHNPPPERNAPRERYSAPPAPHASGPSYQARQYQNPQYQTRQDQASRPQQPHAQAPQQRGGYPPPSRYQSQQPVLPQPPQPYAGRPPAAPPATNRPLITAQPFAPAPGYARPASPPASPGIYAGQRPGYVPPSANLGHANQQHLGGWLQSHSGQSFASQEQSLRQEPGFSRLPQPQQQRLIDRLHQLDTMPPQRRERTLGRIENLERLSPDRRQQVRDSAQELSAMPEQRKQQIRSAFRSLRELPPEERQQQLASPAMSGQYNEHERQILGNLLSVEPYQPQ
jgi:hypothetical protein